MTDLQQASREELLGVIHTLIERVECLTARVTELEAEVEHLQEENLRLRKGGGGTPLSVRPSRAPREKKQRKRRAQACVRRRETPDEVRHHAAECCPDFIWFSIDAQQFPGVT